MPRKAPETIEEAIQNYVHDVQKATLNSIVSITPPGDRFAKGEDEKGLKSKQRAKQGIEKLKKRIESRFVVDKAVPAGADKVHVTKFTQRETNKFIPTNLFLLDRGKSGKKKVKTNLPILNSKKEVVDWLHQNSHYTARGKTAPNFGKYAFYSNENVLKSAAKEIQRSAGMFMAGWYELYEKLDGGFPSGFVPASAMKKAKNHNVSYATENKDGSLYGENKAQEKNKRLEEYAQTLAGAHLKLSLLYYQEKMKWILEKTLQKHFNFDKLAATELSLAINFNL